MTRITKLILLAAIGILLTSATSAAAIEFIWKVNAVKLEAGEGESVNFDPTIAPIKLSGNSSVGATEIKCRNLFSEVAELVGGEPGELDGNYTLTECSPKEPAACTEVHSLGKPNGTLVVDLEHGEIVESEGGAKKLLAFSVRIPFTLKGTGCPAIPPCEQIEGWILTELKPENEENTTKKLIFQGAILGYIRENGTRNTAGVRFTNGQQAFMLGEVEVGTIAGAKFEAF